MAEQPTRRVLSPDEVERKEERKSRFLEFQLVLWFLGLFAAILTAVLIIPASVITGQYENELTEIIEFRKEILALIIAAFGPWIAAGAAYFFGRENLREAYRGMRDLTRKTPEELLRSVSIKNIPPKPVTFRIGPDDALSMVREELWRDQRHWFVVYVDTDGTFIAAIHEEQVWRLRARPEEFPIARAALSDMAQPTALTLNVDYIESKDASCIAMLNSNALDGLKMKYVLAAIAVRRRAIKKHGNAVSGDINNKISLNECNPSKVDVAVIKSLDDAEGFRDSDNALNAERALNDSTKYIGVVVDSDGKPTGYFTTGDIRRMLTGSALNTVM